MNLLDIVVGLVAYGLAGLLGLVIELVCLCGLLLGALTLGARLIGRRWIEDEEADDDVGQPHGIDAFRWTEE
ncbi:hypothetical protein [Streptomyces sp. NPDC046985]|uniref:hypothetical protein n=1 Tax=Streptomyces sp. NPDC046985 TaxID=3155377 RepID=UPI0033FD6799